MRFPERADEERQREDEQQRLRLRLAVQGGDRAGQCRAEHREDDAGAHGGPERRVLVHRAQRLALDQRRAEGEIGEDHHEAREHERQGGEAILVGRQQPCDEDRDDRTGNHAAGLRSTDPDQPAHDARAQIRDSGEQTIRHRHRI
jgi:hypothetical protein